MRAELPYRVHNGIVQAGSRLRLRQAALVRLDVVEVQRIGGLQFQINQLVARLEQRSNAAACVDLVVAAALGADLLVVFQISLEDVLLSALALDPQALGADTLLLRAVFNLVVLPLEPSHPSIISSTAHLPRWLAPGLIFETRSVFRHRSTFSAGGK